MSGGSYDYAYTHIADLASALRTEDTGDEEVPRALRRAFKAHLFAVAKAAKALEWVDSGDGDPDARALVEAVVSPQRQIETSIEAANQALEELEESIQRARRRGWIKETP